ncbi:rhodanese-like domain-containing protein [Mesorhizobium dulcispinae]|uniref:rhodanese-like domain-containing protein n=1 Tax=Mesorhizobium dulcispinae TaxID=3072316 RepID=UPI003D3207CD
MKGRSRELTPLSPTDKIDRNLDKLPADKNAKIVLYCRSGRMSEIAAEQLARPGYLHVTHLSGEMIAWQASGHALKKSPSRRRCPNRTRQRAPSDELKNSDGEGYFATSWKREAIAFRHEMSTRSLAAKCRSKILRSTSTRSSSELQALIASPVETALAGWGRSN